MVCSASMIVIDSHFVLIRSAYANPGVSKFRLGVSRKTMLPSLAAQDTDLTVVVSVARCDEHLQERMECFDSLPHKVKFVFRPFSQMPVRRHNLLAGDTWDLPIGPRIAVSRLDDDDLISVDFMKTTRIAAESCSAEKAILDWPCGYVQSGALIYRWNNPSNQFITMLTNDGDNPHVHSHFALGRKLFPRVVVSNSRGWVWVRQPHSITMNTSRRGKNISHRVANRFLKNLKVAHQPTPHRWAVSLPVKIT